MGPGGRQARGSSGDQRASAVGGRGRDGGASDTRGPTTRPAAPTPGRSGPKLVLGEMLAQVGSDRLAGGAVSWSGVSSLRGHRRQRPDHALPRAAVRPSAGLCCTQAVPVHGAGADRCPAASASTCSTTAARPGRRGRPRALSRADAGLADVATQTRALRPPAGPLLVTAGFTAVLIARSSNINTVDVTYGAIFLGCCCSGTSYPLAPARRGPVPVPARGVLASVGLVELYRIEPSFARRQAAGSRSGCFFLRDDRVPARLPRARALPLHDRRGRVGLLLLPRLAGHRRNQRRYLSIHFGSFAFQPAEFAKIGDRHLPGELPARRARRARPRPRCRTSRLKHIGPLLVIWGTAMLMLIFIRDLGSSLMFFGGFLALLYVATGAAVAGGRRAGLFVARRRRSSRTTCRTCTIA